MIDALLERAAEAAAQADYEHNHERYAAGVAAGRIIPPHDGYVHVEWDELTEEVRERFIAAQRHVVAAVAEVLRP